MTTKELEHKANEIDEALIQSRNALNIEDYTEALFQAQEAVSIAQSLERELDDQYGRSV